MTDKENRDSDEVQAATEAATADVEQADVEQTGDEQPTKLNLDVTIDNRSACERHISVTVSRDDIDRYYDKEFTELMPTAQVPGFRAGRAPRKLIETRFRKDVAEKVKSELLMDSLAQVSEDESLSAISEPDIDLDAVEIPDEGEMTFEFDLEVRPEFDLPKWKGLKLDKPVRDFSDEDIDRALQNVLSNRGRLVPHDGPAEAGDYVTANLTFRHGDQVLSQANEEVIRIRPELSFRDGTIKDFEKVMVGVEAGQTRKGTAELTDDAPNVALRGKKVEAEFEVLEVKRLELPELNEELLEELGGFELEADLRDAIKDQLVRQMQYEQRRLAREQITTALTVSADWELPQEMLQRQSHRELQRAVMELQRSGFGENEIRAHENELRQHSMASTSRALKEHFILERIAEEEEIDASEMDYEVEISLIAAQSQESPRRVRARIEKSGSMDVLRNQIVERKVVEQILEHAKFTEVPYEFEGTQAEALDQEAGGGGEPDIPEAKEESGSHSTSSKPEEPPMRD
ncbi:MAG TPA: trigger factor [Thermoguttaceae bacterium]|nr:trigger factor [Thermoguttaceae bacterium]